MRKPSHVTPAPRTGTGHPLSARRRAGVVGNPDEPIEEALAELADAGRRTGGRQARLDAAAGNAVRSASKARNLPIGTVIIGRRRRGESSVEETVLEIYHGTLSVHQADQVTRSLWGPRVGVSTVSALGPKIARRIDAWRNRAIRGRHVYVFLTGVELKRSWGGGSQTFGVLVAMGVSDQGVHEVLGVVGGNREDPSAWLEFLRGLRKRGLNGVRLFVGDLLPDLGPGIAALFPGAGYQLCVLQFYRSVLALVPTAQSPAVEDLLRTIHTSADRAAARARAAQIESTMRLMSLPFVAVAIAEYVEPTLGYYALPSAHWRHLRSNHLLNQAMRDIRERARVVSAFSDGPSAVHLVAARLRYLAEKSWCRRQLSMRPLRALLAAAPGTA